MMILATASFAYGQDNVGVCDTGFADYLLQQGEYGRAVNYLDSFCFTSSSSVPDHGLTFRRDYALLMSWKKGMPGPLFQSRFASLFQADIVLYNGGYVKTRSVLAQCDPAVIPESAIYKRSLSVDVIERRHYQSDDQNIRRIADDLSLSRRNPLLAAGTGLVPGAGYMYAGNTATGVFAAIVTGLCAGYGYWAWKNDLRPLAMTGFAVGAAFYGGSILGGYREALWRNRQQQISATEELARTLGFHQDYLNEYDRIRGLHAGE
jgi:hypothetical protein